MPGIHRKTPAAPERQGHRYVALVGHEHQQADQLARLLTQQGFQVGVFDAWPERASAAGVDLIVLDLGDAAADQGVELIARACAGQ